MWHWITGYNYLTRARLEPTSDLGKAVLGNCCCWCWLAGFVLNCSEILVGQFNGWPFTPNPLPMTTWNHTVMSLSAKDYCEPARLKIAYCTLVHLSVFPVLSATSNWQGCYQFLPEVLSTACQTKPAHKHTESDNCRLKVCSFFKVTESKKMDR